MNLKIILINYFFEIIFLKTFLCSKIKFKVPKKSQKNFFTLNFFIKLCVRYTCKCGGGIVRFKKIIPRPPPP
jgi:hypothetical protein